jgi:hypothetical protein
VRLALLVVPFVLIVAAVVVAVLEPFIKPKPQEQHQ